MKAIERLFQYFDYKGIKPTRLEKDLGLSNGYLGIQLKRKADIGSGALEVLVNNCRDLNIEWLLLGKGEMIRPQEPIESENDFILKDSQVKYGRKQGIEDNERVKELLYTIELQKEVIQILKNKLLDQDATGASVADVG